MMKTITELEPLIYGRLFARPERRKVRRRQLTVFLRWSAPVLYSAVGLQIAIATGVPPWDWRFWLMFAPIFLSSERALWQFARARPLRRW